MRSLPSTFFRSRQDSKSLLKTTLLRTTSSTIEEWYLNDGAASQLTQQQVQHLEGRDTKFQSIASLPLIQPTMNWRPIAVSHRLATTLPTTRRSLPTFVGFPPMRRAMAAADHLRTVSFCRRTGSTELVPIVRTRPLFLESSPYVCGFSATPWIKNLNEIAAMVTVTLPQSMFTHCHLRKIDQSEEHYHRI